MANEKWLSQFEMTDGSIVHVKDAVAREMAASGTRFVGKLYVNGSAYTHLTDGDTRTIIEVLDTTSIGHHSLEAAAGDIVLDDGKEFIYDGSQWENMGADDLGTFAFVDEGRVTVLNDVTYGNPTASTSSANANVSISQSDTGNLSITGTFTQPTFSKSVTLTGANINETSSKTFNVALSDTTDEDVNGYEVQGTISAPTISVATAGSTTTIKNPTSKVVVTDVSTSAPASETATSEVVYMTYDESTETLSFKKLIANTGASITTSNVDVKTGDPSYEASQPLFSATPFKGNITGTFTEPNGTASVSGTISGTTVGGAYTPEKYQVDVTYDRIANIAQGTKSTSTATKIVTPYSGS